MSKTFTNQEVFGKRLQEEGNSEGAKKGWVTRGRGGRAGAYANAVSRYGGQGASVRVKAAGLLRSSNRDLRGAKAGGPNAMGKLRSAYGNSSRARGLLRRYSFPVSSTLQNRGLSMIKVSGRGAHIRIRHVIPK